MSKRITIDREELYNLYRIRHVTTLFLTRYYKCSKRTIHNWLKRYRIKRWTISERMIQNPNKSFGHKSPTKRPEVRLKMSKNHADFRGSNNPNYGNHLLAGSNNPNWCGGISDKGYPWYWNTALKERIKKRDQYQCQECGTRKRLEVHHIDYNKENCEDNNLITLCKKHNLKANYNRSYFKVRYKQKINLLIQ